MNATPTAPSPAHNVPTVLFVDDDASVRRSVARLIRSAGLEVKTFASPADFLGEAMPAGPACAVLDLCMDEMNGLEVQAALRQNPRRLPVVFLSGSATVSATAACFRGGAEDMLEKPVKGKDLIEAVYRALDHDAGRAADRAEFDALRRRYDQLTPREQEVMAFVVAGLLNKQVAGDMGITEKTVKVHRARVMEKMEVDSLAALVLVAQRLGITPRSRHEGAAAAADEPHLAAAG